MRTKADSVHIQQEISSNLRNPVRVLSTIKSSEEVSPSYRVNAEKIIKANKRVVGWGDGCLWIVYTDYGNNIDGSQVEECYFCIDLDDVKSLIDDMKQMLHKARYNCETKETKKIGKLK